MHPEVAPPNPVDEGTEPGHERRKPGRHELDLLDVADDAVRGRRSLDRDRAGCPVRVRQPHHVRRERLVHVVEHVTDVQLRLDAHARPRRDAQHRVVLGRERELDDALRQLDGHALADAHPRSGGGKAATSAL